MELIYLFLLHFFGDFLFQSRQMGRMKTSDFRYWIGHVVIIFLCSGFSAFVVERWFLYATMTALIHGVSDFIIWKTYRFHMYRFVDRLGWKYYEDKWFYATIGADQMLHHIVVVLLFEFLRRG